MLYYLVRDMDRSESDINWKPGKQDLSVTR